MFYDSEAAIEKVLEETANEMNEAQASQVSGMDVAEEDDSELLALIDEALALTAQQARASTVVVADPFADLLAELEQAAEVCAVDSTECDPFAALLNELEMKIEDEQEKQAAVAAMYANPFEDLLAEITRMNEAAQEVESAPEAQRPPTREEVKELAEELAEETVAEAIQNVAPEQAQESEPEQDQESEPEPMMSSIPSSMDATSKLALAKRALIQARDTLSSVIDLLNDEMLDRNGEEQTANEILKRALHSVGARVVEGVFDGERMVSGDGRIFPVPANYASKSKLVEGDMLKLTVMPDGKMIYKQVGPTARDRVKGVLSCDERGGYCVLSDGARYKVIPASVSFHRGRPGDHVVALVPKGSPSKFAAVDFIVHQ
jgi:hypothetical protein